MMRSSPATGAVFGGSCRDVPTHRVAAVLLVVLLTGVGTVRAQDVPADVAGASGVAAPAASEPPREMTVEEADRMLAVRKQHLLEFYGEWQRKAVEAAATAQADRAAQARETSRAAVAESADIPSAAQRPPLPDAPDGEITLERQREAR